MNMNGYELNKLYHPTRCEHFYRISRHCPGHEKHEEIVLETSHAGDALSFIAGLASTSQIELSVSVWK